MSHVLYKACMEKSYQSRFHAICTGGENIQIHYYCSWDHIKMWWQGTNKRTAKSLLISHHQFMVALNDRILSLISAAFYIENKQNFPAKSVTCF